MRTIGPDELANRLEARPRDFALFDCREEGEAEAGHLPDSTFLPRRLLELRIDALVPARATTLVVYGADDGREALAAATLAELGYEDVCVLSGGVAGWTAAGRPVATGVNVPSKRFGEHVLEHDGVASITADDLDRLHASGTRFEQWDVRTPAEFWRATVPGSRNVPGGDLALCARSARGNPIVVHCAGRTRSIIAARTLALLGEPNVVALENGTMGWRLSGRKLVPGVETAAPPGHDGAERAFALAEAAGVRPWIPERLRAGLAERLSRNLVVVDVRSEAEHQAGHLPGSLSRPGGQLIQCTDEVLAVPAASVVLVDDGDGRAAVAGYWLRRMGFPDVGMLEGGYPAWRSAGLALVSGPDEPPAFVASLRQTIAAIAPDSVETLHPRPIVLDVGTSRAFKAGHIPEATWLPRGWLEARVGDLAPPGVAVVATATDEVQGLLAAATLLRLGYEAAWLEGGNAGWVAAGGRLDPAATTPLDLPPDVVDPPYAQGEAGMRRYLAWEIALTGA